MIIVTFNAMKWIDICLSKLYNVDGVRLIIVDNASPDGSSQLIKQKYPNVTLIESKENLGFGKANNLGLRSALDQGFEYIFLQNQDAAIDEKNLNRLIELAEKNPDYGIISPVHFKNDNEIENLFATYVKKTLFEGFNPQSDKLLDADFINAALWLLPAKTIKEIGGFNPLFSHYGEDFDYISRVKYFGYRLGFAEGAQGFHYRDYDIKKVRKSSSGKTHFGPWHVKYYSMLTNINKPDWKVFCDTGYLFAVSLLKHAIQLNFNSVKWDFRVYADVLKKMPYIFRENRKIIRQKGSLFI